MIVDTYSNRHKLENRISKCILPIMKMIVTSIVYVYMISICSKYAYFEYQIEYEYES